MNPFTITPICPLGAYVLALSENLGFERLGILVLRLIHSNNLTNLKNIATPWSLRASHADKIGLKHIIRRAAATYGTGKNMFDT